MSEVINSFFPPAPRAPGADAPGAAVEAAALRRALDARLADIAESFTAGVPALGQAMAQAAALPGKRFRGVLMGMLAARLGGVDARVTEAACAVELIHTASLVIDDLPAMDGAAMRRGQPTVHVTHGEGRAILVGIALMSESFRLLATLPGTEAVTRAALVALMAEAVGPAGLCGGQDLDLHGAKSMQAIAAEQDLKTGKLFDAALHGVALLRGCDAGQTARLRAVARLLGRAFQSYDDLLDVAGAGTGKTAGRDLGAAGPDKGLLAVTGADGAQRHYHAARRALDDALGALWFDTQALRDYVAAVLPDRAPGWG